jgi:hypothetical protein
VDAFALCQEAAGDVKTDEAGAAGDKNHLKIGFRAANW